MEGSRRLSSIWVTIMGQEQLALNWLKFYYRTCQFKILAFRFWKCFFSWSLRASGKDGWISSDRYSSQTPTPGCCKNDSRARTVRHTCPPRADPVPPSDQDPTYCSILSDPTRAGPGFQHWDLEVTTCVRLWNIGGGDNQSSATGYRMSEISCGILSVFPAPEVWSLGALSRPGLVGAISPVYPLAGLSEGGRLQLALDFRARGGSG